ncbi:MAG: hypothetical protein Q7O66_17615 [Dehalococcoidia bacterium]|nr:hypothetical protein [Dehalococcoidia bacterium]
MRRAVGWFAVVAMLFASLGLPLTAIADPGMTPQRWNQPPKVYINPGFSPAQQQAISFAVAEWCHYDDYNYPSSGGRHPLSGQLNPKNDAAEEVMDEGSPELFDNYYSGRTRRSFTDKERRALLAKYGALWCPQVTADLAQAQVTVNPGQLVADESGVTATYLSAADPSLKAFAEITITTRFTDANGLYHPWFVATDSNGDGMITNEDGKSQVYGDLDFYSTVKHELGHAFSFDHPKPPTTTIPVSTTTGSQGFPVSKVPGLGHETSSTTAWDPFLNTHVEYPPAPRFFPVTSFFDVFQEIGPITGISTTNRVNSRNAMGGTPIHTEMVQMDLSGGGNGPARGKLGLDLLGGIGESPSPSTLIFFSDRTGGYGGHDLYAAGWDAVLGQWGPPLNLGPIVNSGNDEVEPFVGFAGAALFFSSNRPAGGGGYHLYVSYKTRGGWSAPQNLDSVNLSGSNDRSPTLAPDGRTLYFDSDRPGGMGGYDIYTSTISATAWLTPVNVGSPVNTNSDERDPFFAVDGRLYYSSNGFGGFGSYDIRVWNPVTPLLLPGPLDSSVNSGYDELYPRLTSDLGRTYYSSNRNDADPADYRTLFASNSVPQAFIVDSPDPALAGTNVTYTISVRNAASSSITFTNTVVTTTYDSNMTYLRAQPSPDPGTNNQWSLGSLSLGDRRLITVTVTLGALVPPSQHHILVADVTSDGSGTGRFVETTDIVAYWPGGLSSRVYLPVVFRAYGGSW